MANITCTTYSESLQSNIDFSVVIPTVQGNNEINDPALQGKYSYKKGLPVVYLLHGAYGSHNSWLRFSSIERYVQEHNCIAVMASASNSFYQNMGNYNNYFTFFSEELPKIVCDLFPASERPEDTYVAGFSMGGYGAWYIGLNKPERFAKVASMSGAIDLVQVSKYMKNGDVNVKIDWKAVFGDEEPIEGASYDLKHLMLQKSKEVTLPKFYQSCGTEDFLYTINKNMYTDLIDAGIDIHYEEGPGRHDWKYWDSNIQDVLNWFFDKE